MAWEKVIEVLHHPSLIRQKVEELRKENRTRYSKEDIETTIATIDQEIQNLFNLAKGAKDRGTIDRLTGILNELEGQKSQAEGMLYDADIEAAERAIIEEELVTFENWVEEVKPQLTNPEYTPDYKEVRLAIRIIGIYAVVYPSEYPCRVEIQVRPPKIIEALEKTSKGELHYGSSDRS
jgi:hypothetical protein